MNTASSQTTSSWRPWQVDAALVSLALMWGTSHVITKNILATHTPFFYTSLRFGLAAFCFGLVFAGHLRRSQRHEVKQGLLLGLCSFAGIGFYTAGLVFTNASKAGFITGLYLVFTPLLAYLLFRLRPTRDHLLGLLIAIAGFALLSYPRAGEAVNGGDWLILLAALAWALHIVATSVFASRSDARTLAAVQVMVVALLAVLACLMLRQIEPSNTGTALARLLAIEARPNHLTWPSFAQIAYMGLAVTFVAALAQTWAQGKVTPTHAAIIYTLEPVTAALFANLALGEVLSRRAAIGAALIVIGVLLSRLGWLTRLAAPKPLELEKQASLSES
jgi:drug/metabolite transporter (DMT)-like permease